MARKKRKIGFYYLTVINNGDLTILESYNKILKFIERKIKNERKQDLGNNKFCLLDKIKFDSGDEVSKLVFKSAKHNFRPNLIHKDTAEERDSPKQKEEGEIQKTHVVTKGKNGDLIFILEKHLNGLNINQVINYLNHFSKLKSKEKPMLFNFETIVKDDFLEEIDNLSRVICANIHVDKQLLGSEALNYSNRIDQANIDVVVTVKARKLGSIAEFTKDVYAKINGGERRINKIRIVGKNNNNNDVVLSTDFIERQEHINPEVNDETGEFSTKQVFIEMTQVLENF
jgi:hypothetical protein